ncbi:xanthine dehydrogenase family protein molybdopterin-binding subunit [Sphingomonas sp. CGMCC 1.13654]|uniref:Xanthine dehydrogenase family protein molybdopterin-binding subunit n=1 Tax=Sphingomonas chungangi TaxID=2683589 RepID=A0A838L9V4_9SPHN|nr:molybdopterin cofactor-binding domain-containing protein [Sphingomonas chungangi]MBA2934896.1 xanthine dehydrogenase family protein molybdopterin-binding subunit [Sphingomonas chungangi]MVW58207.1 molybdopterin-dependent oxidoreductase [Sphingomonas chungangi]
MAGITRRGLLIGGGAGVGLVVGWSLWPRRYGVNLVAAPGETILGPFLKIGTDGHVTIVVPQVETGQGAWTALPQILADELGCDWRTVAIEPAPIGPAYANRLAAEMLAGDVPPPALRGLSMAGADRWAAAHDAMLTGFSTSIRAFEQPLREAGATARALLCMAAAAHWDVDWRACDTDAGFVLRAPDRMRFADLAAEAARHTPPREPPLRAPRGLSGSAVTRLDAPAKVDGSARFAADVRLTDMLFAAIRQGPPGDSRLVDWDRDGAKAIPDLFAVIDQEDWIAVLADNQWAANRALDRLAPRFETRGGLADTASIGRALDAALAEDGASIASHGSPDKLLGANAVRAEYSAGLAAHAAIEPPAAAARIRGDQLEIWAATQVPAAARAAAARALGFSESDVTLYPMPMGGGFGQGFDTRAVEQAAILAHNSGRPVQLTWSRVEACLHDPFRPPAKARLAAALGPGGTIAAWHARIAAPAALRATVERLHLGVSIGHGREPVAVEGALPPYAIGAYAVDHHLADIGLPTGVLRGEAAGANTFFAESFMDELADEAGIDPLSFRIAQLGANPRLAHCLSTVAKVGDWQGGTPGTAQGLGCFAGYGSFIAVLAEARVNNGRIVVDRLSASVDCGRTINPDLVRQQIEGGLLFALPAAIGDAVTMTRGLVDQRRIGALGPPTLAHAPEIRVDIVASKADPGGVSGLAVPPVAPAIANAIAAATGHRCRTLPLSLPV